MSRAPIIGITLASLISPLLASESFDQWMDDLSSNLAYSSSNGTFRGALSGTIDLEYHSFEGSPPSLIDTEDSSIFQPRTTLFFDLQSGSRLYGFVQARIDRGFDPAEQDLEMRFDEYLLRYTHWDDGRLNLQAGKFSTVTGQWFKRHISWRNPFINAPMIYDQVTLLSDRRIYPSPFPARNTADRRLSLYNPLVWGPVYATGAAASGQLAKFEWAIELKNAALTSHPDYWTLDEKDFDDNTFSARVAWRPELPWTFGLSASQGAYLGAWVEGAGNWYSDNLKQTAYIADVSYERRHFQFWSEFIYSEFELLGGVNARSTAYFLEGRYKFKPMLSGALRFNQQFFSDIVRSGVNAGPWGEEQIRLDLALTYRFSAYSQLQIEVDLRDQDTNLIAMETHFATRFTLRF